MIVHDSRNPRACALYAELEARMPGGDGHDDLVVTVGGDGFLLHAIGRHGFDRTYVGLNAGHLGFLLNEVDDWDRVIDVLKTRALTVHDFPVLRARIELADGSVVEERAVNDVYLERSTGQTARLGLAIDGHTIVDVLTADGVIFSTALGSTAYTFSAGGAPCHPALETLSVTPICPHLPRLSPFVLPSSSRARVDVRHADRRPVRAVADGRSVEGITGVEISPATERLRLGWFQGHDFTSHLVRKILHP